MDDPAALSAAPLHLSCSDVVGLPELSRSQTTLEGSVDDQRPSPGKRKSLRLRPDEALQQQHALPPSPLKPSPPAQLESRKPSSKMSLFSLFSKPKVEKLRGYAEQGMDAPSTPRSTSLRSDAALSKSTLVERVETIDPEQGRIRPVSSKSSVLKKSRTYTSQVPLPNTPNERPPRRMGPPPLFQVWPQAIKSATLEVSSSSSDISSLRSKARLTGTLLAPTTESLGNAGYRGSADSRVGALTRNGSISGAILPRKTVVLTTSGALLQYAETGPSDRFPEKLLQLGKDSAAFASDLIPGKHHVLQVSKAVDADGVPVANAQSSIFSRLSIRRATSSRTASVILMVMSGPEELNEWISIVKKSIEEQGGKRARSDSTISRPRSREQQPPQTELTKTPSIGQRYQVRRDPDRPLSIASPHVDPPAQSPPQPPPQPVLYLNTLETNMPDVVEGKDLVDSDVQAPKEEDESVTTRPRAPSDCPSISSSTALSVEQLQLEKLRSSVRMSHSSTAATSFTAASRASSTTSSPSDHSKDCMDSAQEMAVVKLPHRTLASLASAKRRSVVPVSLKGLPENINTIALMQQQRLALMDGAVDSPVVGFGSPLPEPSLSPRPHALSFARSTPDLKSGTNVVAKHDSRVRLHQPEDRPESFIADLPNPTLWSSKPSPTNPKSSSIPFPPLLEIGAVDSHHRTGSDTAHFSPTSRPLRSSSNSFSLPRSAAVESSTPQPLNSRSPDEIEERVLSPIPAVHTLTAKVDVATRTKIDESFIPARKSSTSGSPPANTTRRVRPPRLSLFPSTPSSPPPIFPRADTLRRSPSVAALSTVSSQVHVGTASAMKLTRPTSLQVRTNHAPFLSALRSATDTTDPRACTPTVPIRSLKPSRSMTAMQMSKATSLPPSFSYSVARKPHEVTIHETQPHFDRVASPSPGHIIRPSSRIRKSPRLSSQGIDVLSLGPPAPPPSAPLPDLPSPGSSSQQGSEKQDPKDRFSMTHSETSDAIDSCKTVPDEESKPRLGSIPNEISAVPETTMSEEQKKLA